ncbi:MAG: GH92 family glycosyl hydrolase [Alistipes sp.]|nr:GH92 family glycosyl hydrolase [Alistipes sp.]
MIMKRVCSVFVICVAVAMGFVSCFRQDDLTCYVDQRIGTGGHGHVFMGANVPFGLVQVGPTSIPQDWDWCSGYHESDSTVIGFSHTHLSGTGIGDLFDVTVMPVVGEVKKYARGHHRNQESGLWSYADRSKEKYAPGYYSVPLTRYGVVAEMTATSRVGMHRYTFPASDEAAIVFDLQNGGCWDSAEETYMQQVSNTMISGWRLSRGWANNQKVYFVAEFSRPFDTFEVMPRGRYARANFKTEEGEQLMLKVALSPTSVEGAKLNLASELSGWNFDATCTAARRAWNEELSKIRVTGGDDVQKRVFYTALYHTMIAPSEFCDVDGTYRGADARIYPNPGHKTYTTYSLWDTYRAAMPLLTILQPERMSDMVNTMLNICDEQGRLPVWHLWGCETDCMVGNPGVISVADAIVKNIEGVDMQRAFEAVKRTSMHPGRGNGERMRFGYIPVDKMTEAVAKDMEFAIADGAAANAARKLNKQDDLKYFDERSHSYRNYFDTSTGFIRGLDSKREWRTPFDPYFSAHGNGDYCEGNAWQYTWLVPQDIKGLEQCFASREKMVEKLDSLFSVSSHISGENASPDISGLIGQYAHGNEPSHHVTYLYTMLGQPWKTAERVREVMSMLYHDREDGLSGNEDVGQMSAWYVMSAMGMYEIEPAGGRYWFGSPIFNRMELDIPAGKFTIIAQNNSSENRYIQHVWLNGEEYHKPYIEHSLIMQGGELRFEMGAEPALWYEVE